MTAKINTSQLYTSQELLALMKMEGHAWPMVLAEVRRQLGYPDDAPTNPKILAALEAEFPERFMEDYIYIEVPGDPISIARCVLVTGGVPKEEGGVVFDVTLAFPVQGTNMYCIVKDMPVITVEKVVDGLTILGLARADQFSSIVPQDFN